MDLGPGTLAKIDRKVLSELRPRRGPSDGQGAGLGRGVIDVAGGSCQFTL